VAQKVMRRLNLLRDEAALWDRLDGRLADALEFLDLAEAGEERDDNEALVEEVAGEVDKLEEELEKLEFRLLLSGEYDRRDAILAIHAGAGGTESQDWVDMLLRMYLRWAEQHNYETQILDSLAGEEAGLKSVTVEINGPYAYGRLKAERGVHRLVRISPFDASRRRHTSFALVEVMPELEDDIEIVINPDDLRIDVFRSSGAGGQHVQKNATAVRITHLPTDIVVSCQNERSQVQNREMAMKVLRSRLLDLELAKREAEHARLKGKHVEAGWGNQIRSYVLHPYHMVKDHRTGYETGNTTAVLNGDLEGFIEAYLREHLGAL
jgi:peptide chain release factor 2